MRRGIILAITFLTGFAMSTAEAAELKWDGKTFDTKLVVRSWDRQGKQFIKEQSDVPAFRGESKDGKVMFWVKSLGTVNSMPLEGSELTDTRGVVWVVMRSVKGGGNLPHYVCTVAKKP